MNWELAIEINRRALLRVLRGLLEMVGAGETVTRGVRNAALAILLPAEAAARRLIVIAARGIVVETAGSNERVGRSGARKRGRRRRGFSLVDPRRYAGPPRRKRVPGQGPGVRGFDGGEVFHDAAPPPLPDDPVCALRLSERLTALGDVLDDVPVFARRLARMDARPGRSKRAMRPGRPPGHRARGRHPVDEVLADCHALALMALVEPVAADTS